MYACCAPALGTGEFVLDFEESTLTEQNVRDLIYEELVNHYHPND
jgi:mitogen-activated protein kinase 1/3